MRPIPRGYYSMPDLNNGSVSLEDVALANDHMDAQAENEARARAAAERKN